MISTMMADTQMELIQPSDLGARINEAHALALEHAGRAIEHAITCGELLLKAKADAPHGSWLPWLRHSVSFGERTAQAYMRIARRVPRQIRSGAADLSVRGVLKELAVPRRNWRDAAEQDLAIWMHANRSYPNNSEDWSIDDARACADHLRAFDEIMHRHGLCPDKGAEDPSGYCLVCCPEPLLMDDR
jgi:hypothetical protein